MAPLNVIFPMLAVLFTQTAGPSACVIAQPTAASLGTKTIGFRVAGEQYQGQILHWTPREIFVLRQDGSLLRVDRTTATDFRVVSDRFVPLPVDVLRASLLREFGRQYTVDATTHYLVVRPIEKGDSWKDLFESTYRNVERFSAQRRLPTRSAVFPLVAIVLKTEETFREYLRSAENIRIEPTKVLGFYDPVSNRVVTFDLAEAARTPANLPASEKLRNVIRHEAFHQVAANIGLINRSAAVPLWFHEGMALLFEGEFVNPSCRTATRILSEETGLKAQAKFLLAKQPRGWLRPLVLSDDLFSASPETAYALSWALVNYLSDKRRQSFTQYLMRINRLAPFEQLSSGQRESDFIDAFGERWEILESSVQAYTEQL
ncbi:MAG: DUF1570 domain-containing protein [Thermogutta sp.]